MSTLAAQIMLALALAGPLALPAEAQPGQLTVPVAGRNLADPAVRADLEKAIDRAAASACGYDKTAAPEARRAQLLCVIATGNAGRADLARLAAAQPPAARAVATAAPATRIAGL